MAASTDRSGFTLVETMVASSIATIVTLALVGTFLFCQKMFRLTIRGRIHPRDARAA